MLCSDIFRRPQLDLEGISYPPFDQAQRSYPRYIPRSAAFGIYVYNDSLRLSHSMGVRHAVPSRVCQSNNESLSFHCFGDILADEIFEVVKSERLVDLMSTFRIFVYGECCVSFFS